MPARILSFSDYTPKSGLFSLLLSDLFGHGVKIIGVLLLDPETDRLYFRLRRDWHVVAEDEDVEVLAELGEDLASWSQERGGTAVLGHLEKEASQSIRVTDR